MPLVAVTALLLGAAQTIAGVLYLDDAPYLAVLLFLAAFLCVLGSAKLKRDNCFESRFVLSTVAASTVAGHILSLTLGLPGSQMDTWSGPNTVLSVASVAVALLLLVFVLPHLFTECDPAMKEDPRYDS